MFQTTQKAQFNGLNGEINGAFKMFLICKRKRKCRFNTFKSLKTTK